MKQRRVQALQQLLDNVSGTLAMRRLDWMCPAPSSETRPGEEATFN